VKELEREGLPVAIVTAMADLARQVNASRITVGVKIAHPCGDPSVPVEEDRALRRAILCAALGTLEEPVATQVVVSPRAGVDGAASAAGPD
jgi:glycine reductase complex component B subunit gamma